MSITSQVGRIIKALGNVANGKAAIADALTSKGVPTDADATFDTMAVNVGLIDGGGGGDGYAIHETVFESTGVSFTFTYTVAPVYIDECIWFYYYPTDASNTAINTICVGYYNIPDLPTAPTGVVLKSPNQYYVNDQTYGSLRMRGNIQTIPAGTYKLVWFGTAK